MTNSPLEALLNKMSSMQEKVYCVFEYAKTSSVTVVRRRFRTKFRKEPPHRHNISRWVKQFQDTGCLCKNKSPGLKKKNPKWLKEFVFKESLKVNATCRYQMVQALKPTDKPLRKNFCVEIQENLDVNGFKDTLVFTDEATFHLRCKVNRHNLGFGGTENVHVTLNTSVILPRTGVCASSSSRLRGTEASDNCSVELHHKGYAIPSVAGARLAYRHLSCHRRGTYRTPVET
ncbi:DUF4817 domain-containing protein [Trichonephila clavipes]|nr:DUF4817 domain-containing protein [Trichonephila clavipes]